MANKGGIKKSVGEWNVVEDEEGIVIGRGGVQGKGADELGHEEGRLMELDAEEDGVELLEAG